METKLKIYTALTIPYAFFCAGLYQIAFWSPFNINGFSFLDIADIIKSFIQPFLYSSSIALFFHLIHYGDNLEKLFPSSSGNIKPSSKTKKRLWLFLKVLYIVIIIYLLVIFNYKWKGIFVPYLFLPIIYYLFAELSFVRNFLLREKNGFFVFYLLAMLPVLSFTSGADNGRNIYENITFDYTTSIIPNKPMKFLGKASNYYIFISIDNKDKYIYSTEEIKGLQLKEYKSK